MDTKAGETSMGTAIRDSDMVQGPSRPAAINRRDEPFFNKYVISGRTYVTGSGAVVPNELQYYDGAMAHFYGECTNVSAVDEALAGSGFKAITLRYADGRQTALGPVSYTHLTLPTSDL